METKQSSTHDRELVVSRTLNAPVDLIWEVWTKPEHIANWWGPTGFTNTITKMDMVPGGDWELIMHGPDGTDYPNKSIFREIIPFEKIVYEHASYPNILATITFEARGEQTYIHWHMLFESAELLAEIVKKHNAKEGQKQNLDKLEIYLTEHKSKLK
jgi:uncharacterized protein YndB with AHSA1/START domain